MKKITFICLETLSIAFFLSIFANGSWSIQSWNMVIAVGIVYLIYKKYLFHIKFNILTFITICLISISHQTIIWCIKTFPLNDPQLVILTLQMPLDGFTSIFAKSFIIKVVLPCLITSFFISLIIEQYVRVLNKKKIFFATIILIFSLFNILTIYDSGIPIYMYKECLSNDNLLLVKSNFFQDNYTNIDSVKIEKTDGKTKNLVFIIMESIENSFADSISGGVQQTNLIMELMPKDSSEYHFSFNQVVGGGFNTVGTLNTISATVAKTTGVPLLLRRNYSDTLLEKVSSIYDVLNKYGYNNIFIQGTDANFSGTKNYVLAHGINTLYDMHSLKKKQDIETKYRNFRTFEAGITDRTILEVSKFILDTLASKEHFSLTIATIETHFPYGFYNKNCEDKPNDSSEQAMLEATIRCASKDMRRFISWIKNQPFYPNTEIVIVGDHLFMGNYLINANEKDRKWFNLFINPSLKPSDTKREFTSVDIAPTILESLGFSVEKHKMGFGVSLFSSEKTLVEKIGINALNREFANMRKSVEYNNISQSININRK